MKPRLTTLLVALWLVLTSVTGIAAQTPMSQNAIGTQAALGTNFAYQGFLNNNGKPANGAFDFEFTLYDALTGGTLLGTFPVNNQTVSKGLFTVMIDFGPNAFNGSARFLQIKVRPAGVGELIALNPRVELAAVPNARFSSSTGGLQGRPVSGAAPAPNQVLRWNGSQWVPASVVVTAPLNLTGATGPILAVVNTGTGRAGTFTNGEFNFASLRAENNGANGLGILGVANSGANAQGVRGDSSSGTGVLGLQGAPGNFNWIYGGVSGRSYFASGSGVSGFATAANSNGVFGRSDGANGNGVHGIANGDANSAAVWGESSTGWAGYFSGAVFVNGTLNAANKQFKIDHPLDPTNKYLYHTSVESPDMKNIYDGVVTLDANGAEVVDLPAYFQALNQDFRYQLTCIGGFAPIYIDQEIANNRFSIAGGEAGMKVSWQVTGIRHDAYAQQNRSPVEQDKPADQRGTYLYPSAYGQPETLGVDYARQQQVVMKQSTRLEGR